MVRILSTETLVDAHPQADGTRYVIERHTDSLGRVHTVGPWMAPPGCDIDARARARAVELAEQLSVDEEAG